MISHARLIFNALMPAPHEAYRQTLWHNSTMPGANTNSRTSSKSTDKFDEHVEPDGASLKSASEAVRPREIGGRIGPDPTRFGDWEKNGRCIDF